MEFLQKIVEWAKREDAVRLLILQGSRARDDFDPFSDYDLALVCRDSFPYTESDKWLEQIPPVWVCVKEERRLQDRVFPTRLVIFEGGIKVDFSFFSLNSLDLLQEEFSLGYQILLDKDNRLRHLPDFPKPKAKKPSEREFLQTVEEFWFEAYHVAVALRRGDLWTAKFRSSAMHLFLLRMIEWDTEARSNWAQPSPPLGKKMSSWVDPEIWRELHGVFAHFDADDSKQALLHSLSLFRRLAQELSARMGVVYPNDLDRKVSQFIVISAGAI